MNSKNTVQQIKSRLAASAMSESFCRALQSEELITEDDTALIFYDLTFLEERIANLKNLFPPSTLHAIAAKANPLPAILAKIKELGMGVEVASLPELYLAERTGFPPEKIVFDSPCKTKAELEYALKLGVYLNADSFDELDRIGEILKTKKSASSIGLRLNPQVGAGSIKSTSVADDISKFGVPVNDNSDRIKEYYLKYSWLKGVHVHIGSQGCPVPLIIEGIGKIFKLVNEINNELEKLPGATLIDTFDIGGGLPVSYFPDNTPVSMAQFFGLLSQYFPGLFNGQFRLITEFGRYIYANTAWVASKVEYVKRELHYNIVMTHVGADLFLRKCYNPGDWHHEVTVVDKAGKLKTGLDKNNYIIAGPLCFAGDIIAKDLTLPVVAEGDYLLIHDAGAYTLGMWSRYNSRQIPKVIAYRTDQDSFEILKDRELKKDLFDFWT